MLCSVVTCYIALLNVQCVTCCEVLLHACAVLLHVALLLLNFVQSVICCDVFLHVVVVTCVYYMCAVLLDVTKSYYMLCSVVTCYIVLLNFVQQC